MASIWEEQSQCDQPARELGYCTLGVGSGLLTSSTLLQRKLLLGPRVWLRAIVGIPRHPWMPLPMTHRGLVEKIRHEDHAEAHDVLDSVMHPHRHPASSVSKGRPEQRCLVRKMDPAHASRQILSLR